MADLVITSANVLFTAGTPKNYNAAEAVVAGESVYLNASDEWALANNATALSLYGVALNSATLGQTLSVLTQGTAVLGAILTIGQLYMISANNGKIAPITDIISTNYYNILGYALDASTLVISKYKTPVALA